MGEILAVGSVATVQNVNKCSVLACIYCFWGKGFSFAIENCENDVAITIASILRHTFSHFHISKIPMCILIYDCI